MMLERWNRRFFRTVVDDSPIHTIQFTRKVIVYHQRTKSFSKHNIFCSIFHFDISINFFLLFLSYHSQRKFVKLIFFCLLSVVGIWTLTQFKLQIFLSFQHHFMLFSYHYITYSHMLSMLNISFNVSIFFFPSSLLLLFLHIESF